MTVVVLLTILGAALLGLAAVGVDAAVHRRSAAQSLASMATFVALVYWLLARQDRLTAYQEAGVGPTTALALWRHGWRPEHIRLIKSVGWRAPLEEIAREMSVEAVTVFAPHLMGVSVTLPVAELQAWYTEVGPLAPLAMKAGMDRLEATLLASEGALREEDLAAMIALRS